MYESILWKGIIAVVRLMNFRINHIYSHICIYCRW